MSTEERLWQPVLDYWLGPDPGDPDQVRARRDLWFGGGAEVDREIERRFGACWREAARGGLDGWVAETRGALALVLVLDQFSRNLGRGRPAAFAQDPRALAIATALVDEGADRGLHPSERSFLYLPFEHAEDLGLQRRGVELFTALDHAAPAEWRWLTEDSLHWARLHLEIIERFGRFPHRNHVLGRASTEEERRYLAAGGKTFGQ